MTSHKQLIWHIAGLGAMGTLFASSFCRAGVPVQLILKNEQRLAHYQSLQLQMSTDDSEFFAHPPACSIESLDDKPIDYLVCCTKAYDVTKLLLSLEAHLNEQSIIILIHNGVGVIDEIKQQLPTLRIISGITTLGGYLKQAYAVRAFLSGALYLGPGIGTFSQLEIDKISETFKKIALPCQWLDNIQVMIWEKFAINCSINLLTALFSCKNGALLAHQELLERLTMEISQVLMAYGCAISSTQLLETVLQVITNTAANYSSMYQDIHHDRLTELNYLNVHLVRLAEQKNINIPLTVELLNQFYKQFPHQK